MTATNDSAAGPADGSIQDEAALRLRYRAPHPMVLRKQQPRVDEAARSFLKASPFMVLATTSPRGTDVSPRGGAPGFVVVLDDDRIAFGDLSGNNRLDSYGNIVEHPEVGLLFFVPGLDETLRVNGRAHVTGNEDVLHATAVGGVRPKTAVVIEVTECFIHCGKAPRRAGLWDSARWSAQGDRPSPSAILVEHLALDVEPSVVEADLEAGYTATMWVAGGTDGDTPR
jgi:uncharacterized protein